jgi:hypothetical protein
VQRLQEALRGEPIGFLVWSDREEELLARALAPAEVERVEIDFERREARIYTSASDMPLAIGRDGSNVRLAARLPRMRRIEVKAMAEIDTEERDEMAAGSRPDAGCCEDRMSHGGSEGKILPAVSACGGGCPAPAEAPSRERGDTGSSDSRLQRAYQAAGAAAGADGAAGRASAQHLDRRVGGEPDLGEAAAASPCPGARQGAVCLLRAPARAAGPLALALVRGHPVGDRRWRERGTTPAEAGGTLPPTRQRR